MLVKLCWPAVSKVAPADVSEKQFSTSSICQRADLPGVRTAMGHPDVPKQGVRVSSPRRQSRKVVSKFITRKHSPPRLHCEKLSLNYGFNGKKT